MTWTIEKRTVDGWERLSFKFDTEVKAINACRMLNVNNNVIGVYRVVKE
jgi:hypothetical protein